MRYHSSKYSITVKKMRIRWGLVALCDFVAVTDMTRGTKRMQENTHGHESPLYAHSLLAGLGISLVTMKKIRSDTFCTDFVNLH